MDFNGKTALITGSGAIGGLGHGTARILAAGGANVIITGTDPDRGTQVVQDVRGSTAGSAGTVRFIPADLADLQAVQRLAEDAGAAASSTSARPPQAWACRRWWPTVPPRRRWSP
jgi:NAD(P)-dependent dehydrogenase (short-subunit alcohol dehydrogenase family)